MLRRYTILIILALTACQTSTVFTVEPGADTPAPPAEVTDEAPAAVEPTAESLTEEPAAENPPQAEGPPWCVDAPPAAQPSAATFRIAYADDGQIWILDEGQSPQVQASVEGVRRLRLSDDGQMLAYTKAIDDYRSELNVIDLQTGVSTRLIDAEAFDAMAADLPRDEFGPHGVEPVGLQFIPGTHTLIFWASPLYSALGGFGINDLWLVDADAGVANQLLPPGEGGNFRLAPDGSQFVLLQQRRLQFYAVDGTPLLDADVEFMTGVGLGESLLFPPIRWVEDDQAVIIPNMTEDRGVLTIWRLPLDGSPAQMQGSVEDVPLFQNELSPNNELLLSIPGQTTLIITDVETGVRQAYMNEESIDLIGWAPDSASFLFETLADPNAIDRGYRTSNLAIGHICDVPRPFTNLPEAIGGDLFTESVQWLDSTRFVLARRALTESAAIQALGLYLGSIDGTLQELARLVGDAPSVLPAYHIVVLD